MEANIVLFKCTKTHNLFGVRVQKFSDGDWYRTWAFRIKESSAKAEGFDKTPIKGNLYATKEYPGCPDCGTKSFVQCNNCKKLSCWNGEDHLTCPWCGNEMRNITEATEKFNVSGNDY